MEVKKMLELIVKALSDKKAKDIEIIKIDEVTTLADYFVICTGTSNTHIKTLAEAVEFALAENGTEPHHIEGHRNGTWTLLDYIYCVVHVFTGEAREFYNLDKIWADGKKISAEEVL